MNDWKYISKKVKCHVTCNCYVEKWLKVAFFGKINLAEQLRSRYNVSAKFFERF